MPGNNSFYWPHLLTIVSDRSEGILEHIIFVIKCQLLYVVFLRSPFHILNRFFKRNTQNKSEEFEMIKFLEEDTKISELSLDRMRELKSEEFVVINYAEADTDNSMHLPGPSKVHFNEFDMVDFSGENTEVAIHIET